MSSKSIKVSIEKAKAFLTLRNLHTQKKSDERDLKITQQKTIMRESTTVSGVESTTLYLQTIKGKFESNDEKVVALYGKFGDGAINSNFFNDYTIWFPLALYTYLSEYDLSAKLGYDVTEVILFGCDFVTLDSGLTLYFEDTPEYDGFGLFPIDDLGLKNTQSAWLIYGIFASFNSPYESTRGGKLSVVQGFDVTTLTNGNFSTGTVVDKIVFRNYLEQEVKVPRGWLIANFVLLIILFVIFFYYQYTDTKPV